MEIPLIDIAPFFSPDPRDRLRVAREWDHAFSTIGFATITGHGIPELLMENVHDVGRQFFARPLAEKITLQGPPGLGYEPFQASKLAQSKGGGAARPDLVEALMIQAPEWDRRGEMQDGAPANFWPGSPTGSVRLSLLTSPKLSRWASGSCGFPPWRSASMRHSSVPTTTA